MPLNFKILAAVSAALFFYIFLSLVRRRSMQPFYVMLWFVISLMFISLVVFEKEFKRLADFLQLTDASFFVIVGSLFFLMVYVLHLSMRISEMSDRIQELISTVAILENQVRKHKDTESDGQKNLPHQTIKDENL